jgi:hypothetical protein
MAHAMPTTMMDGIIKLKIEHDDLDRIGYAIGFERADLLP